MNLRLVKVLTWVDNTYIVGSIYNRLYLVDITSEKVIKSLTLPSGIFELFRFSKLGVRFFRLGIQTACICDGDLYVAYRGFIYIINLKTFTITKSFKGFKGKRPLYLVPIENIKNIENGVYFGEYFMNENKLECSIFSIKVTGLTKVYTFKANTIEHIHNLIPDPINECVWIFTGDFGSSSGIYQAKSNFSNVSAICTGDQIYRACFGFPYKEGLAYFTDSQLSVNHLRYLFKSKERWKSLILSEIPGPCIYGTLLKDFIIYSTSCEPELVSINFTNFLTNTPSKYIKSKSTTVTILNKNLDLLETISYKKDKFPMILFQFGNVFFPSNNSANNILFHFLTATEQNDQKNVKLDLDKRYKKSGNNLEINS